MVGKKKERESNSALAAQSLGRMALLIRYTIDAVQREVHGPLPESPGHNLAATVSYVPHESGREQIRTRTSRSCT